jgi:nucleotide-binding universal stress UspA family protein
MARHRLDGTIVMSAQIRSTMFENIIVGVDARQGGRDALALAATLSRAVGGRLIAVHAYAYDFLASRGAEPDLESSMHGAAMLTLERQLEAAAVRAVQIAVSDGSPGRALHRAATRHDGELIVIGSAHRGAIGRVLAGDVTAATLHGAPCPVLVAPAGYADRGGTLETVGVGYDGSPASRAAVALARDVAEAAGARLRIIEVVVPPTRWGPYPVCWPDWTEELRAMREEAAERVARLAAAIGDFATGVVMSGEPAHELACEGDDLDLLVTGSHNHGPLRRVMLGSTSGKLVHGASCPVLITTRTVEAGLASAMLTALGSSGASAQELRDGHVEPVGRPSSSRQQDHAGGRVQGVRAHAPQSRFAAAADGRAIRRRAGRGRPSA